MKPGSHDLPSYCTQLHRFLLYTARHGPPSTWAEAIAMLQQAVAEGVRGHLRSQRILPSRGPPSELELHTPN